MLTFSHICFFYFYFCDSTPDILPYPVSARLYHMHLTLLVCVHHNARNRSVVFWRCCMHVGCSSGLSLAVVQTRGNCVIRSLHTTNPPNPSWPHCSALKCLSHLSSFYPIAVIGNTLTKRKTHIFRVNKGWASRKSRNTMCCFYRASCCGDDAPFLLHTPHNKTQTSSQQHQQCSAPWHS